MRQLVACVCRLGMKAARRGTALLLCPVCFGLLTGSVLATGLLVETWREPPVFISYCSPPCFASSSLHVAGPLRLPLAHNSLHVAQLCLYH